MRPGVIVLWSFAVTLGALALAIATRLAGAASASDAATWLTLLALGELVLAGLVAMSAEGYRPGLFPEMHLPRQGITGAADYRSRKVSLSLALGGVLTLIASSILALLA